MDLRALTRALEHHDASDDREAAYTRRIIQMIRDTSSPLSREQLEPGHLTASAFVLSPDGGALLLVHHDKLGLWLQPGGHIDGDDGDIASAARREVAEEAGLHDLIEEPGFPELLDVDIHDIPANPRRGEGEHQHFDLRVLFRSRSWELRAGSDALDARWVPIDEVADAGTDDSVRRAVHKIRGRR